MFSRFIHGVVNWVLKKDLFCYKSSIQNWVQAAAGFKTTESYAWETADFSLQTSKYKEWPGEKQWKCHVTATYSITLFWINYNSGKWNTDLFLLTTFLFLLTTFLYMLLAPPKTQNSWDGLFPWRLPKKFEESFFLSCGRICSCSE